MILIEPDELFLPGTPGGELAYQRMLLAMMPNLAKGYAYNPWSPKVRDSRSRIAQPDAILWRSGSTDWWVVEVERADHPGDHIRRQLDILEDGIYDWSVSDSIGKALGISLTEAGRLLSARPGFLVIFDEFNERNVAISRSCGFEVAVLEPYRTDIGKRGLHVQSLPSWFHVTNHLGRFPLRCMPGIGASVTLELPSRAAVPPGRITLVLDTGETLTANLHAGKIRVPGRAIKLEHEYSATIVSMNPLALRIDRQL